MFPLLKRHIELVIAPTKSLLYPLTLEIMNGIIKLHINTNAVTKITSISLKDIFDLYKSVNIKLGTKT